MSAVVSGYSVRGRIVMSVLLMAVVGMARTAAATQVSAAMAGLVTSGTDITGVFGAPNSSLKGDSFTLNCIIDDQKGTAAKYAPSIIESTGTIAAGTMSNPEACSLSINGGTVVIGFGANASGLSSSVVKSPNPGGSESFGVSEAYNLAHEAGEGSVGVTYRFMPGSLINNNWEQAVFSSTGSVTDSGSFYYSKNIFNSDGKLQSSQVASGNLAVQSLSVSPGLVGGG
jgi:hypothetical protein